MFACNNFIYSNLSTFEVECMGLWVWHIQYQEYECKLLQIIFRTKLAWFLLADVSNISIDEVISGLMVLDFWVWVTYPVSYNIKKNNSGNLLFYLAG